MADIVIQDSRIKVWDDVAKRWVLIHPETKAEVVLVGNRYLTEILTGIDNALGENNQLITEHADRTDVHTNPSDKSKLGNLADDAENTYAKKSQISQIIQDEAGLDLTEVIAHLVNIGIHLSPEQITKLTNLALDASATYATKAEVAGKRQVYYTADIAGRDALSLDADRAGDSCWVLNASDDPTVSSGAALYGWDGTSWLKLAEAESIDIECNWGNIVGRPASSVSAIDAAVLKAHGHTFDESVLNGLGEDTDGGLEYKGKPIGIDTGRVFLIEPSNPQAGDTWYEAIN